MVGDDVSVDLDIAMAARRSGIPGAQTPRGILTRLQSTVIAQVLSEVEDKEDPAVIECGFMLLTLGEDTVLEAARQIRRLNKMAQRDQKPHDFTMNLSAASSGFTFHCSNLPFEEAQRRLYGHCLVRKYAQHATSWFGICLRPGDIKVRTGATLQYQWTQDATLDDMTKNMRAAEPGAEPRAKAKIGRNELCPCGSGSKYKKCCLGKPTR